MRSPRLAREARREDALGFEGIVGPLLDGYKVTRLEWGNRNVYVFMHDGYLSIKKEDGSVHALLVRDVDMWATDWVVLTDG